LPQVTADYAISGYFRGADGVYVNLYVPSRLTWTQGSVRCALVQETGYPTENLVTMRVTASAPVEFALHLRVPGWAGRQSSVSVNGKRLTADIAAGTFYALRRAWKSGDVLELDLDLPTRTEPVDAQTPDQVAVMRGPQVLFAIADRQLELRRAGLDRLQLTRGTNQDWKLALDGGDLTLRPFADIGQEVYQTYLKVV
jgi:DUF1680 family protein